MLGSLTLKIKLWQSKYCNLQEQTDSRQTYLCQTKKNEHGTGKIYIRGPIDNIGTGSESNKPSCRSLFVDLQEVLGKVAYIGATQFSSGKWIGLVLDEPKVGI